MAGPRSLRKRAQAMSAHMQLSTRTPLAGQAVLWFVVPKKILPRAVDRNALRRVGKEAWRAAGVPDGFAAFLKLLRRNDQWKLASLQAKKRWWRAEIDGLLQDFLKQLAPGP
jgi:hypothetical protein